MRGKHHSQKIIPYKKLRNLVFLPPLSLLLIFPLLALLAFLIFAQPPADGSESEVGKQDRVLPISKVNILTSNQKLHLSSTDEG